jgi:malate dehydrogenase
MKKLSIIGAGNVGTATAIELAKRNLFTNIQLIDTKPGHAAGTALDISHSSMLSEFDTHVSGSENLQDVQGSHIVIVTAGLPRKPGMSRSDLLKTNARIFEEINTAIGQYAHGAIVIVVTNPIDALTFLSWKQMKIDKSRIIGLGGVLDGSRMSHMLGKLTGFSTKNISSLVIGGHGDFMVPLTRYSTINGIPIRFLLTEDKIKEAVENTRFAGAEVLTMRGFSSFETPAASLAEMIDAIINDRKQILSCVAVLDGEYHQKDLAMSVPVTLTEQGIEKIIELPLTDLEFEDLVKSANSIRQDILSHTPDHVAKLRTGG